MQLALPKLAFAGFLLASPLFGQGPATTPFERSLARNEPLISENPFPTVNPQGFYTDEASYAPGETVRIHGNWAGRTIKYRVLRVGKRGGPSQWDVITETAPVTYSGLETLAFGSFVDFPGFSLDGLERATLEGWVQLSEVPDAQSIGADDVVIAGQLSLDVSGNLVGPLGIARKADGTLVAVAVTDSQERLEVSAQSGPPAEQQWIYVAATWNGSRLALYLGDDTDCLVLEGAALAGTPGRLTSDGGTFRIGARGEAPGDQTGVMDGKVDRWGVWPRVLAASELKALRLEGSVPASCPGAGTAPSRTTALLFADFEDPYGAPVSDGSGNGHSGVIVNHGRPGIAGRPAAERGLGLNHDQLFDVSFQGPVATFDVGANWSSGMYAIEAVCVPGAGVQCPSSLEPLARDYRCFVVRPSVPAGNGKVIVIVPVNTWTAYNPWPGDRFNRTAAGLTQRADLVAGAPVYRSQGNNSVYGMMGDGVTHGIYADWRRPNLFASPIIQEEPDPNGGVKLINETKAYMDSLFIEWLENPSGGILAPGQIDYDVFTDWDLDGGLLDLDLYTNSVVVLLGHHEYWSAAMLDEFAAERSMSLLTAGGNAIIWRAETALAPSGDRVVEVRGWPLVGMEGLPDAMSHIKPGERMGLWRFLRQTGAVGSAYDDHLDYVLGVLLDLGGGLGPASVFGYWRVASGMENHWLWGGDVSANEELLDPGRVVGYEADTYVCPSIRRTTCPGGPGLDEPATLPTFFPFSATGTVSVLAAGSSFGNPTATSLSIDWWQPCFDATDPTSLDAVAGAITGQCYIANDGGTRADIEGHGNIVYYLRKDGVSGVLTISSNYSPVGLHQVPQPPAVNRLSRLAERALDHWLFGGSYPGPDIPTGCPPSPVSMAPRR